MKRGQVVKVFRVKMSEAMAKWLDTQIEEGVYISYADAIRRAIDLLGKERGPK